MSLEHLHLAQEHHSGKIPVESIIKIYGPSMGMVDKDRIRKSKNGRVI